MPDVFVAPESEKSGIQRRLDQLTREKYSYKRQSEAAVAESSELRVANMRLEGELGELRNELQQAKSLLQAYRVELEKYRAEFVEIVAKEKHGKR